MLLACSFLALLSIDNFLSMHPLCCRGVLLKTIIGADQGVRGCMYFFGSLGPLCKYKCPKMPQSINTHVI